MSQVNRLLVLLWLGAALLLAGCGDDEGGGPESDTLSDVGDTGGGDQVDPCSAVSQPCAAAGRSCDGNDLVICAANSDGCLVETVSACGADEVCDDTQDPVSCVASDPCADVTNLCETASRACDGSSLVVCAEDANGCLVETVTDCASETGANFCDDTLDPVTCSYDPCLAVSTPCTVAGATCDGSNLVVCTTDGFGCLVEETVDCTTGTNGACDSSVTPGQCTSDEVCVDACTAGATSCDGNTVVRCVEDAFGCLVEVSEDCTTETNGYCDATGAGATCAIDTGDRCADKTLCTVQGRSCASNTLVECGYDAMGCLVESSLDCTGGGTTTHVCKDDGAGSFLCGPDCAPEAGCETASEGDSWCGTGNAVVVCTDNDSDGCLELATTACVAPQVCSTASGTPACAANGSGESCADVEWVLESGFVREGTSFASDFTDDLSLTDGSCQGSDNGQSEAVFGVELVAGQMVWLTETGSMDSVLSILAKGCGDADVCEVSADLSTNESRGVSYVATADETVYLVVESYFAATSVGQYAIHIDVLTPECGNGVVDWNEACDDGNLTPGDGCSATCTVDLAGSCAAPLVVGTGFGLRGDDFFADFTDNHYLSDISCNGDDFGQPEVVLSMALEAGQTVVLSEHSDLDSVLSIQTGGCGDAAVCAESADLGWNESAGISYTAIADETVFLVVESYDSDASTASDERAYEIRVELKVAICGNGVIEGLEQCDDQESTPDNGDGCSASCTLETGWNCTGEPSTCVVAPSNDRCDAPVALTAGTPASGDSATATGDYGTACGFSAGAELVYTFVVADGEVATVTATPTSGIDVGVALATSCAQIQANGCVDEVDQHGSNGAETASWSNTTGGPATLYIVVDAWSAGTFEVVATAVSPSCGDGVIEGYEKCDDGGTVPADGDGCSAVCELETGYRCFGSPSVCLFGGGDSCADPFVVTGGAVTISGSAFRDDFTDLQAFGDVSCEATSSSGAPAEMVFAVELVAGELLEVEQLGYQDVLISILASCDDAAACVASTDTPEELAYTAAVDETVFVVVETWSGSTSSSYEVRLRVRVPQCGDGVIDPNETCDDGRNDDGDGCTALCELETGFVCSGEPSVCLPLPTNDTCATAEVLSSGAGVSSTTAAATNDYAGSCGWSSRDLVYAIDVPTGSVLTVVVTPASSFDPVVSLSKSCTDLEADTCFDQEDALGQGVAETIQYTNAGMSTETIYIVVDGWLSNGAFTIVATVS